MLSNDASFTEEIGGAETVLLEAKCIFRTLAQLSEAAFRLQRTGNLPASTWILMVIGTVPGDILG